MAALLRIGAKFAIAGGAVYVTLNEGVWSSGNFGSNALERVKTNVLPTANEMVNKLPSCDNVSDRMVTSWNKGVSATFRTLGDSPRLAIEYGGQGVDYIRNLANK